MPDARAIVEALGGRWHGRGGLCFCPAHDNRRTPALSVSEADDGRLLLHCHAGCAFADILAALRERGLAEGGGTFSPRAPDPAELARRQREDQRRRFEAASKAHALWRASLAAEGTVVGRYLERRGIVGPIPPVLRFLPDQRHPNGGSFPVMIARIDGAPGFAVHRTFLTPEGEKAPVDPVRLFRGSPTGGGVRICEGPGPLVVAEGLETTLSVALMVPGPAEVWAAMTAGGMAAFRLPEVPDRLIVAVDGDRPGRDAGRTLADRACAAGWTVEWADPGDGLDFNDVLTCPEPEGEPA